MDDATADILAGCIRALGSSKAASEMVLYAYRLGVNDGQRLMAQRAEGLLRENLPEMFIKGNE